MSQANSPAIEKVVITRIFDAPRELVFQAWIEPEHLMQWWGPHYFTCPHAEIDARPGGAFLFQMQDPEGKLYPTTGVVREIAAPERLVLTTQAGEDGAGGYHLIVQNTVTFEDLGGRTKMTMTADVIKVAPEMAEALTWMETGWSQSFEKLTGALASGKVA